MSARVCSQHADTGACSHESASGCEAAANEEILRLLVALETGCSVTAAIKADSPAKARFAMTSTVRVEIDAREHERDLVGKFYQWQHTTGVYPLRGSGHSGPGRYVAFFDTCDAEKVRAFFVEHGSIEFESQV